MFILIAVVVQLLGRVQLFVTPWTATHQDSLSFAISWNWLKLTPIESLMPQTNKCVRREKIFHTVINVEGMMNLENHHFAISIVIIVSGKKV